MLLHAVVLRLPLASNPMLHPYTFKVKCFFKKRCLSNEIQFLLYGLFGQDTFWMVNGDVKFASSPINIQDVDTLILSSFKGAN